MRTLRRLLILFLAPWIGAAPALGAFEDTGSGARNAALGGAAAVLADDTQALMVNPAGLARLEQAELTSEYSKLHAGLSDSSNLNQFFAAYGKPLRSGGALAIGWKQFSLSGLYGERTVSLGYGRPLAPWLSVGAAFKQLHHSFVPPDSVVDNGGTIRQGTPSFFSTYGRSKSAYSADAGLLATLDGRHRLALAAQDITEPDVALSNLDQDVVRRTVRAGYAYSTPRDWRLAGGVAAREGLAGRRDFTWTGAFEKWWNLGDKKSAALRGSLSLGSREVREFALGLSGRVGRVQVDYALVSPLSGVGIGQTAGTHRISLTWRFDVRRSTPTAVPGPVTVPPAPAASPAPAAPEVPAGVLDVSTNSFKAPAREEPRGGLPPRLGLLLEINSAVSGYGELTRQGAPAAERLAVLERLFDPVLIFGREAGRELGQMAAISESWADTVRYYDYIRSHGASDGERFDYMVRSLEKVIEPALRLRVWGDAAKDEEYRAWLRDACDYSHRLRRENATADVRLEFLGRMVQKAIRYEWGQTAPSSGERP